MKFQCQKYSVLVQRTKNPCELELPYSLRHKATGMKMSCLTVRAVSNSTTPERRMKNFWARVPVKVPGSISASNRHLHLTEGVSTRYTREVDTQNTAQEL